MQRSGLFAVKLELITSFAALTDRALICQEKVYEMINVRPNRYNGTTEWDGNVLIGCIMTNGVLRWMEIPSIVTRPALAMPSLGRSKLGRSKLKQRKSRKR